MNLASNLSLGDELLIDSQKAYLSESDADCKDDCNDDCKDDCNDDCKDDCKDCSDCNLGGWDADPGKDCTQWG